MNQAQYDDLLSLFYGAVFILCAGVLLAWPLLGLLVAKRKRKLVKWEGWR